MAASPPPTLWTVGHSNHDLDAFLALLAAERIEQVIDIRSFPYSRWATHFNREELEQALAHADISYAFLGFQLGGRPHDDDQYDDEGHALYDLMAEEPEFQDAIEAVLTMAQSQQRLALMCSCGEPDECHRRLLVGKVLTERDVQLRHILPDGSTQTETEVPLAPPSAQISLFGEEQPAWRSTRSVSHRRRLNASSAG